MLFFMLALVKCNQEQRKKHPATHTVTLISKIIKNVIQVAPKWAPMDPGDPPLGLTFVILPRLFCEVTNRTDFGALWAGAGGRGRGLPEASESESLTTYPARPAPPSGVRRI